MCTVYMYFTHKVHCSHAVIVHVCKLTNFRYYMYMYTLRHLPHILIYFQHSYPSYTYTVHVLCTCIHWGICHTFWSIFNTPILHIHILYMYFVHVYSSVSIYQTFTRFIAQCPVWLAVSTPLHIYMLNSSIVW